MRGLPSYRLTALLVAVAWVVWAQGHAGWERASAVAVVVAWALIVLPVLIGKRLARRNEWGGVTEFRRRSEALR